MESKIIVDELPTLATVAQALPVLSKEINAFDFDRTQDIVGQLACLKTYAHLALCFPVGDDAESRERVTETLSAAGRKLIAALPWLAGTVINPGRGPGNTGYFKAAPSALNEARSIVRFKDCSELLPSYDEIMKARGPSKMLIGDILSPYTAFPLSYEESESDPPPVVLFQANFIKGGLVLDCATNQTMIDMSGLERCFELLAAAMRGEEFPAAVVDEANRDRRGLVPLLKPGEKRHDHSHLIRWEPPKTCCPPPANPDSKFTWRYWRFTPQSLADLKLAASKVDVPDPEVPYITTNDALTAFCWQRVTKVRLGRQTDPNAVAKFARAVNFRTVLGVPRDYMGCLVNPATTWIPMKQLAESSLAQVAATMRKDVTKVNTVEYIRSFATFLSEEPDKSRVLYGGKLNPETDVGSSSWAHVLLSHTDFGPALGLPQLIRRPDFFPAKSVLFFMPQTANGDIDALFCLNEEDVEALNNDEEWTAHADYIG